MIIITGTINTDKETYPRLLAALQSLCEPSRQEDGCLFYHMGGEDAENGVIVVTEGWTSREALDTHLQQPIIGERLGEFDGKFKANVKLYNVSSSEAFG